MPDRRSIRRALACAGGLLLSGLVLTGCSQDGSFPSRPVTLICPWSAGGGTDRVTRQVAVQLEQELGVPVNVVNATGGGGVTGHTRGAMAKPDGYTLTMGTVELNMLHWRGLCPIAPEDFAPLALLNTDDAAIFVRQDAPWQTIEDLEAAMRSASDPLRASGTASGGIWHVALVGWLASREIDVASVLWISINGAAPSLQELMAGGLEVVSCSIPEARSLMDAGEVRCLGVMSETRSPVAPTVPTFREQGIDWTTAGWRGLLYPHDVPPLRREVMQQAIRKVAASDEFAQFMASAGFQKTIAEPAEFAQFLEHSDKAYGKILGHPPFVDGGAPVVGRFVFPVVLLLAASASVVWLATRGDFSVSDVAKRQSVGNWRAAVVCVVAIALFIAVCDHVGYIVAAATLLLVLMVRLRVRILPAILVVAVLVPGLYQLFSGFLGVPLPWGWLAW